LFTDPATQRSHFSYATFSGGNIDFYGATFSSGTVDFRYAAFSSGTANFRYATFSGGTVDLPHATPVKPALIFRWANATEPGRT
jgi:uncharacterized protein YjbI with pentapeptide repeats